MANALMAPGGAKVTTEGLTAENVVSGQTVTVKQGSKTVASVTGSGRTGTLAFISGKSTPASGAGSYRSGNIFYAANGCVTYSGTTLTVKKAMTGYPIYSDSSSSDDCNFTYKFGSHSYTVNTPASASSGTTKRMTETPITLNVGDTITAVCAGMPSYWHTVYGFELL
ncbi:MAG: hypothetical protein IJ484_01515 [Oscillospiraceae bacterium]|nr:hypothetical protein [Oscillospiraceae bacterium]